MTGPRNQQDWNVSSPEAIDTHAHFGSLDRGSGSLEDRLSVGSPEIVVRKAREAGIRLTFCSPLKALVPDGGDVIAGNAGAARAVEAFPNDLRFWFVLDPKRDDSFVQARDLLSHPQCVGIKIHPIEHRYDILEHGDRIFSFAVEHGAIVQSHSGEKGSWPMDFVPFADALPNVRLIVSHLGCGSDGRLDHQVRAVAAAKHHNIWTDTSSMQSLRFGLIEWAVGEIGSDRILFGSDTVCYSCAAQVARIAFADISKADKQAIFTDNAVALFDIR